MFKLLKMTAIVAAGFLVASGAAHATSVPAGTLKLNDFNVSVDNVNDTVTLSAPLFYGAGLGQFTNAAGAATGDNNPFTFSAVTNGAVSYSGANIISNFLTFSGADGEVYTFSLDQSITTVQYSFDPTTGGTVNLYLLGDLTGSGPNPFTTPTQTAVTLQLNETGTSGYSFAGTLANPPPGIPGAPAPEPASMFLMGTGLAALGLIRRRRAAR
jgi:hypothetical protein